ncbi:LysR substrate-binding domain-containing protein [Bradyrhizobium sp. Arg237L]|uniref:LysR substrate-binding domain-containing protein n=1 Tax=Bradyrhizobium sp. Arg237L TaxID=3003352 RepID=UPI00249EB965|nr:LysR substrate-binding domain-containing protein [Bradyrhizobium sp. Arg237L]MDI4235442.1 LysR substrate-binding domain-containing protein [Bradyrhizobium sp. Arg237L]
MRDIAGLADAQSLVNGRVRIGAPEGLGAGYLGRKLFLLSAAHPELEIELVALPRTYSLAAREVDISITLDRPVTGQVTAQKLTDYTLDLYGSDIYFQRMGRPRSLQDLRKHVFVGYIPELLFTQQLNFLDLGDGVEVVPTIRTSSVIAQVDAVVSGAAIGVLPRYIARERPGLKLCSETSSRQRAATGCLSTTIPVNFAVSAWCSRRLRQRSAQIAGPSCAELDAPAFRAETRVRLWPKFLRLLHCNESRPLTYFVCGSHGRGRPEREQCGSRPL